MTENTDSKRTAIRKEPTKLDEILVFHNPQGHPVAQATARVATNNNVDVYVGKIVNPVHILASRIVDGWESPHWLGIEGEHRELADGEEPVKIENKDLITRVYDIAEREWQRVHKTGQQDTKEGILSQIDPLLLEQHDIVIKHMRPAEGAEHRLSRETGPMQRIAYPNHHDNLVRYFGALHDPELGDYLLMEYIPGKTLKEFLVNPQTNNRITPQAAVDIIEKVLLGTMHLHRRGIIHRDLKPSNVVIRESDASPIILDLGVSKNLLDHVTIQGATVGTLSYMSPEQYADSSDVDARTDVYALGTILAEMLTGHQPYPFPKSDAKEKAKENQEKVINAITARAHPWTVRKFLPDIHPELEVLVEASRAKFPDDRFTPEQMLRQTQLVKEHRSYFADNDRTVEDSTSLETKRERLDMIRKKMCVKVARLSLRKLYRQLEEQLNDVGRLLDASNYPAAQKSLEQVKAGIMHYTGDDGDLQKRVAGYRDAIKSNMQYTRLNALLTTAKRASDRKDYVDLSAALGMVKKELDQLPAEKHPAAHQDYAALTQQLEPHQDSVNIFNTTRKTLDSTTKDVAALMGLDTQQKPVDTAKLQLIEKRLKTVTDVLGLVDQEIGPKCAELQEQLGVIKRDYDYLVQKYRKS